MRSFGHNKLSFNYRMAEFAGALGSECLKTLDAENKVRISNHHTLAKNLNNEVFKVIEPSEGSYAVYYSNLIEVALPLEKQENLLDFAKDAGIPLKRTWQPLHKHPSFLRKNMNNHFAPWDNHYDNFQEPSKLKLKVSEEYQEKKLFELDCHPLVTKDEIIRATLYLKSYS